MTGRILIVEDDRSMGEMLEADLRLRDLETIWHPTAEEVLAQLQDDDVDVVLTDLKLVGLSGLDLCARIVANRPDIPVVVLTAFGSMETAMAAIRAGAYDFVNKPVDMDALALVLERALQHHALQAKVNTLSAALAQSQRFEAFIGESLPMQQLYQQLARIASSDAAVLITGESGTGKELVAQALHRQSRRATGPFVPVNCPALPPTLLESELFGHVRGAFTDARTERTGLFVQADGGTVLLDEIGDFPLDLQPKLLRVLETSTVRPVGSSKERHVDVRVFTATNRDLDAAVEAGRFREDLFYRINVITLAVPPLRDRGTDILLLAQHFLVRCAARSGKPMLGITEGAAAKLLEYAWPGNVRELRNAIERAVALTRYERLVVEDLPEKIRTYHTSHLLIGSENSTELISMEEVERRYIQHVLTAVGGNKTLAARILGFDRKTLYRKLAQYGLEAQEPGER
jgi:two-component system response regulator HydG